MPHPSFLEPVITFFTKGGFFMIPLTVCSVVSVALILQRALALRRGQVMPEVLVRAIEEIAPDRVEIQAESFSRLVAGDPSSLGRIVQTCLRHLGWSKSENVEAVQTRARHEISRLESGMVILEVIVGISPLLGLLGTVSGLVAVFGHLGAGPADSDPRGVAAGIAEALNTTIVGLCIAIPSLVAHSYFTKKIETMAVEMESLVGELLAKCYPSSQERPTPKSRPSFRSAERGARPAEPTSP